MEEDNNEKEDRHKIYKEFQRVFRKQSQLQGNLWKDVSLLNCKAQLLIWFWATESSGNNTHLSNAKNEEKCVCGEGGGGVRVISITQRKFLLVQLPGNAR